MTLVTRHAETVAPEAWCHLIRRRCGLMFREAQIPAVLDYLRAQMHARGVLNERRYYALLTDEADGGPEWASVIEQLLNHETSFFRHPPSYDVLRTHILPELRQARGRGSRLNIWSAGCSTGQETYSLAMVARDVLADGEPPVDFTVWGGDISRHAVDVARRARYGPRAAVTVPDDYRRRFLRPIGSALAPDYEVVPEIRERVRFAAINLVASAKVSLSYDIVFCHNVLIYLSPMAVSQVVALLASRLALGGYLMLGPGEAPSERPSALEAVNVGGVRLLRRRAHSGTEARS